MIRDLFSGIVAVRLLTATLRLLPAKVAETCLVSIARVILWVAPRHWRVGMRNLELAFPEKEDAWRRETLEASLSCLARVLIDFSRLPTITPAWVHAHVECDYLPRYQELRRRQASKGILIATGHLGSFELLAHCMPMWGLPISFVVRNFEWKALDDWWTKSRERYGNKVINRKGAFKEVGAMLRRGEDVALLFDQNVTRNHATFVDWFGIPAATTKTVAIAALRAECLVLVAGILSLPNDRYRVLIEEVDFGHVYADSTLSSEQKIDVITQELAKRYERFIREQPEAWFWFHRRWRTRPEGSTENFYAGC